MVDVRILVVDDDAAVCWALQQVLEQAGYLVSIAADAVAGRRAVRRVSPGLVLTDIRMPGESGLELLAELRKEYPTLPVVVMTAHGTMETAIEAVGRGAFDYLSKPLDLDRTLDVVRRALGKQPVAVAAHPDMATGDSAIIGSTPVMQDVYRRIAAAAATDMGVLITGPSGSGKELVARALHRHSKRSAGPFIAVNCGALPERFVERELFGSVGSAASSAESSTEAWIGHIQSAHGGTLFLDEIGELPLPAQVKLLRFLEDHRLVPSGGSEERQVDVRVLAATNKNIHSLVASGVFREDLSYRLRVVSIALPPLLDRLNDIPALVQHFLARTASRMGRSVSITDEAMTVLSHYQWPGNVRELKHVVEEAAVLATGGIVDPEHLSIAAAVGSGTSESPADMRRALQIAVQRLLVQEPGQTWKRMEDDVHMIVIQEALSKTAGNQLRAAELLGINRITLKKRMDELGITLKA